MRDSKLFLAELWIGKCYISTTLHPTVTLLFRIGTSLHKQVATLHNTPFTDKNNQTYSPSISLYNSTPKKQL